MASDLFLTFLRLFLIRKIFLHLFVGKSTAGVAISKSFYAGKLVFDGGWAVKIISGPAAGIFMNILPEIALLFGLLSFPYPITVTRDRWADPTFLLVVKRRLCRDFRNF